MGGPAPTGDPRAQSRAATRRRHRRLRQAHGGTGLRARSEINVTPFVDVVLVLLIIFMVVTPMLQRGVDVLLPLTDHHAEKQDTGEQIIVSVRRDGAVFLDQERVTVSLLEERLRPLLARTPPPPVFVKGDRRLTFGPVRKVLEAVHRAGAGGAALATEGEEQ